VVIGIAVGRGDGIAHYPGCDFIKWEPRGDRPRPRYRLVVVVVDIQPAAEIPQIERLQNYVGFELMLHAEIELLRVRVAEVRGHRQKAADGIIGNRCEIGYRRRRKTVLNFAVVGREFIDGHGI
jgi:hypothetical protein